MKTIKVIYDKPENLIPYVNNNKIHSDEQILRLAGAISEFGFDQPIVVDSKKVIIKGHARREAAIKLRLKKVPVVIADHLNEYQVKAARIADNKTASTEYNEELLKFDLGSLKLADYNLALTGLQETEIDSFLKQFESQETSLGDIIGDSLNTGESINNNLAGSENLYLNNENKNVYSEKIETPIYEPTGEKPELNDLIDTTKYKSLCSEIEKSSLSKELKEFLMLAASRHIVFNYEKIANFYAHSDKNIQEHFENSALVIIDFNKAVENGFVKLSKEMNESYINNGNDEEESE